ncbi:uracil-DNA glycosylase [Paenibacillus apiarius]|uniref:Type-4 uracil-DNA glycosylase n=1 Tax=Paenibacillus apiarius TaxID=46240 RepID=A0ABT4DVB6_9BACL|nr:uracil-DNA glycosylase [Paenibacillus apiarius]MCY9513468.1 uracil-DNA glycosylase [Paenibacillus apiarius]MCY9521195.1 uracil-DNA glycosylase [Paenibacillus apiarius]MCY9553384.1 uracil-DNA glycosylase [Paenibacillus apiarius]MCY9559582.1 uracil-DNA glycosylase [Paenibacillus apiarius]MCY9685412.1 uracil-DNA glycosylase [Paenibacillus apiarius]
MTVDAAVPQNLQATGNLEALQAVCQRVFVPGPGERLVFGEGPQHARLLLLGEAPGEKEAETGRPFVGNSGRLLDKYLQRSGIRREEVYVTNVLKVRPPGNRTPRTSEVKEALPVVLRQIELIRPAVIVCLGSIAVQAMVDRKAKITEIRGVWQEKDGIRIMPTYHPSAVFRDENKRELLKQDLSSVAHALGEPGA